MSLRLPRSNPPRQSVEHVASGMRLIDLREDLDHRIAEALMGHPLLGLLAPEDREDFEAGRLSATAVLARINRLFEASPYVRDAYEYMAGAGARYSGKFRPQE